MAQELLTRNTCDWHGALEDAQVVEAVHVRISPKGKAHDLCEPCCMIFDWAMPRLPQVLSFLNTEVIERLLQSGREAGDKPGRQPAQLALPGAATAAKADAAKAPDISPATKSVANRGRWIDGEPQVRCPLKHPGANSPKKYWVKVSDRGSHAASSHQIKPQEINWVLPDDDSVNLPHKCTDHKVCAAYDNGAGYGFPTPSALATHKTKAKQSGWELADTDTTATGEAEAA